jgi:hypothetical protein
MTKGGGCACGARGHPRADFHLCGVDDDTIQEQCHPWSALGKRPLVHSRWHALTPCLEALGQGCDIDVLLCLGIALPQLLHEAMLTLRSLLSSTRQLLTLDHLREVYSEQPRWLAFAWRQTSRSV